MINLTPKSWSLLSKILENHDSTLISHIASNNNYTIDIYNELRQIVGDELISKGFQSNWEPNEYGLELENLIDELGRLFM